MTDDQGEKVSPTGDGRQLFLAKDDVFFVAQSSVQETSVDSTRLFKSLSELVRKGTWGDAGLRRLQPYLVVDFLPNMTLISIQFRYCEL